MAFYNLEDYLICMLYLFLICLFVLFRYLRQFERPLAYVLSVQISYHYSQQNSARDLCLVTITEVSIYLQALSSGISAEQVEYYFLSSIRYLKKISPSLKCSLHTISKLCIRLGSDLNKLQCKILCTKQKNNKQNLMLNCCFVDSSLLKDQSTPRNVKKGLYEKFFFVQVQVYLFPGIMILTVSRFVNHEKFCKLVIFKLRCYFFYLVVCLPIELVLSI